VTNAEIIVVSASGKGWSATFKFDAVDAVQLMRPEEWSYSSGEMLVDYGDDIFLVVVPYRVSLDTLANVPYRLDLAVSLSG